MYATVTRKNMADMWNAVTYRSGEVLGEAENKLQSLQKDLISPSSPHSPKPREHDLCQILGLHPFAVTEASVCSVTVF